MIINGLFLVFNLVSTSVHFHLELWTAETHGPVHLGAAPLANAADFHCFAKDPGRSDAVHCTRHAEPVMHDRRLQVSAKGWKHGPQESWHAGAI